jgi:hypothetical protein
VCKTCIARVLRRDSGYRRMDSGCVLVVVAVAVVAVSVVAAVERDAAEELGKSAAEVAAVPSCTCSNQYPAQ